MTDKQAKALAAYTIGFMPDMSDPEVSEFLRPHIEADETIREMDRRMVASFAQGIDAEIMGLVR